MGKIDFRRYLVSIKEVFDRDQRPTAFKHFCSYLNRIWAAGYSYRLDSIEATESQEFQCSWNVKFVHHSRDYFYRTTTKIAQCFFSDGANTRSNGRDLFSPKFNQSKTDLFSSPVAHSASKSSETTQQTQEQLGKDHSTNPKRNHTFEALQRVSAILDDTTKQETKSSPSNSLLPLFLVKPLNRTFSDKSTTSTERRSPQIEQGIVSQYTIYQRQKSVERFSSPQSYTSSQVDLRRGLQPTNTPEERATYKIKRSASAESEEFLKVDISIRGGTSYLPSEARRIQTPPLPEEGADGKWRGFFFDYNVPRADSDIQGTELFSSGNTSSANAGEELGGITPNSVKALGRTKTNRSRRVVTGDWYDVKLKQFDVGQDPSQVSDPKSGEKRLNSPVLFEKSPPDCDKEQFDLTIPEHLPSSPLCPRHPRYWRVVKGRGSQFRGCWMHGVGLDESRV
ncbi:hypothetical protein LTR47_004256 [Exophiala xenobiotica]|nr:hypothetical protein LTR92_001516 [Exophiala xenobiotica]KAK5229972.1 hypothetical protein LTR72_001506 [Exophiala xenobiotica]KAK5234811.1 hypothetical protein LTR47_004256 [Exophiala xenobiotica]KAK5295938.1 hypothetical protein LTR14_003568 [Exophiala xenobiotica]KAK5349456.1 hypothetical protein LTR61_006845 [Exophiala xenobiotica]